MKDTNVLIPLFKKIDAVVFGFEDYPELKDLPETTEMEEAARPADPEADEDSVVVRSIN